ncbi:putative quinol monooxygenase [Qipengyuania sp. DY56-A-20]|jgi:quinol monooxygenase YgiN|uniref:Quinol monooxygenase n=1 Tax=Qipengyuania benthica TaxID=3067651 RepID=A0ABT9HC75_9SPHN|nr:putative quinol monooxygenase [Qipengyuania sp. DY56-A-20]MDP4540934.1 putative quinol monooxygenase [Qipengyuania sp. DY56-A-20]
MIQINGTLKLAPDTLSKGREAIVAMVRASRAEDGCLEYGFAQDLTDPDVLYLVERWRDRAALDAHSASPHMAEFKRAMAANPAMERDLRIFETDDGLPLG